MKVGTLFYCMLLFLLFELYNKDKSNIVRVLNIIARLIALASFLTGTFLLLWYYNTNHWYIVEFSYWFILWASVVNVIALLAAIVCLIRSRGGRQYLFTIGFILMNIPIAFAYGYFLFHSMNEAKHTFYNGTHAEMKDITICGCGVTAKLAALDSGASTKVRFKLDQPCSVSVSFLSDGRRIELYAFGTDRAVKMASWDIFVIEKDVIYSIDPESLKKYGFK